MYTLLRSGKSRDLVLQELPGLAVAVLVAEVYFKFHSFTLECLGFLVVWTVASALLGVGRSLVPSKVAA